METANPTPGSIPTMGSRSWHIFQFTPSRRLSSELIGDSVHVQIVFRFECDFAPVTLRVMITTEWQNMAVGCLERRSGQISARNMRDLDRATSAAGNRAIVIAHPITMRLRPPLNFRLPLRRLRNRQSQTFPLRFRSRAAYPLR